VIRPHKFQKPTIPFAQFEQRRSGFEKNVAHREFAAIFLGLKFFYCKCFAGTDIRQDGIQIARL
jgi:hypothetical protein